MIVDAQIHEPGLRRYWDAVDEATQHMALTESLHTMLAAVGVDAAVLHPVEDIGWAHGVAAAEPERFVVVPLVGRPVPGVRRRDVIDLDAPDLAERLDAAAARPGCAGFRCLTDPHDALLRACERHGLSLLSPFGRRPELVQQLAHAYPGVALVLDQMALPFDLADDTDPWAHMPDVLALAELPNVSLKLTGLPSFSRVEFPYDDVRPHVRRLVDAFGARRCMWASDISYYRGQIGWANRFPALVGPYRGKHTYAQSLAFLRDATWLTIEEKDALLGGSARRLFWPADTPE